MSAAVKHAGELPPVVRTGEPSSEQWVSQVGDVLTETEVAQLNEKLIALNGRKRFPTALFVVANYKSLPPADATGQTQTCVDELHRRTFDVDGGRGIAIGFFRDQRKLRWRAGTDKEPILKTDRINDIGDTYMMPHFKQDHYFAGLNAGIDALEHFLPDNAASIANKATLAASVGVGVGAAGPGECGGEGGSRGGKKKPSIWSDLKAYNASMLRGERPVAYTALWGAGWGVILYYTYQVLKWLFWAAVIAYLARKLYRHFWPPEPPQTPDSKNAPPVAATPAAEAPKPTPLSAPIHPKVETPTTTTRVPEQPTAEVQSATTPQSTVREKRVVERVKLVVVHDEPPLHYDWYRSGHGYSREPPLDMAYWRVRGSSPDSPPMTNAAATKLENTPQPPSPPPVPPVVKAAAKGAAVATINKDFQDFRRELRAKETAAESPPPKPAPTRAATHTPSSSGGSGWDNSSSSSGGSRWDRDSGRSSSSSSSGGSGWDWSSSSSSSSGGGWSSSSDSSSSSSGGSSGGSRW